VGYPKARAVININGDLDDLTHYARTTALPGDIGAVLGALTQAVTDAGGPDRAGWRADCAAGKAEWQAFKAARIAAPPLHDAVWQRPVLTQPAAIHMVADFARRIGAVKFFDAGDVQANGFQLVEDDAPFQTFTETGASYMGFAASALLGAAAIDRPQYGIAFTGDGSFMMNPQILIDAVEHGIHGMIALFDNRRMAAITGLQLAQYGVEFRTSDSVPVDYVAMAGAVGGVRALWGGTDRAALGAALEQAHAHPGLSLIHIPVYSGEDPVAQMGAYGSWNVGNWVDDVQNRYLEQSI
jgi:3D-(3,5/4)-trihydroxycyclohexane-1,2-dione acylhydrolase (decyclizing)